MKQALTIFVQFTGSMFIAIMITSGCVYYTEQSDFGIGPTWYFDRIALICCLTYISFKHFRSYTRKP